MTDEPSVLDYVKAKLMPWRGPAPVIPDESAPPAKPKTKKKTAGTKAPAKASAASRAKAKSAAPEDDKEFALADFPWRSAGALLLFLIAQLMFGRSPNFALSGLPFLATAVVVFVMAARNGEWRIPAFADAEADEQPLLVRRVPLALALIFFALTLWFTGGNTFTLINVSFWFASIAFSIIAFWQLEEEEGVWPNPLVSLREGWGQKALDFLRSRWGILLISAFALAFFFRFWQLGGVPPEMQSDHAEKLFDVYDVLNGQYSIFFPRNTGREPLQFYLTAFVAQVFGTGVSFLSLKIGTALFGFLSLIYMYLLGKEVGGRWVGLLAVLLTGIAYWPNVIARAALRFMLYPALVAPTLYHLIRAFRRTRLNDFLLAGLFMGIGLHGYTPFRAVPFVALGALVIYLVHKPSPEARRRVLIGFALMALVALVVFAPLLRYAIDNPDMFGFRMLSRFTSIQTELPGNPIVLFFGNLMRALGMVNVSGGNIWLVGLPFEPALETVGAALFLLGVALVVWRYWLQRNWTDLFLLAAVPMLMIPSIMSLAYPDENPAMNRAGGALVAVFLICALGFDALLHGIRDRLGGKRGIQVAAGIGGALLLISGFANYGLVFERYNQQYTQSSWNTSEMGAVIAEFAEGAGNLDQAWVVSFPHWVDTRLVAINAGNAGRDYGIWPDTLATTVETPLPKLFLLRPDDTEGLSTLQSLYPQGSANLYQSAQANKDFLVFIVETGP